MTTDPVIQPIADPYQAAYNYANLNPVRLVDPRGRDVNGICVNGEGAWGFLFGEVALCIVISDDGQAGVVVSGGGGGGVGVGADAGVSVIHADAKEIYDLEGPFVIAGGSGAVIVGLQGEGFTGAGHCGQIVTGGTGGVVVGGTGSVQVGATGTIVLLGLGQPKSECPAK